MRYKIYRIETDTFHRFVTSNEAYIGTDPSDVIKFSGTGSVPQSIINKFKMKDKDINSIWSNIYIIREDSAFFNMDVIEDFMYINKTITSLKLVRTVIKIIKQFKHEI